MAGKPECYGALLPDLSRLESNKPAVGKALGGQIRNPGIVAQSPEIKVDAQAWEECQACKHYRSCYDLSMAKLALRQAMANQ